MHLAQLDLTASIYVTKVWHFQWACQALCLQAITTKVTQTVFQKRQDSMNADDKNEFKAPLHAVVVSLRERLLFWINWHGSSLSDSELSAFHAPIKSQRLFLFYWRGGVLPRWALNGVTARWSTANLFWPASGFVSDASDRETFTRAGSENVRRPFCSLSSPGRLLCSKKIWFFF